MGETMAILKVLLVDDEIEFVSTLSKRLKLRGFDSEYATSGEEALICVRDNDYDIVILDINMPGIRGVELIEKMETYKKDMKFILVTGYGDSHEVSTDIREKSSGLLVKPIDIKVLIEKMKEVSE
jgi:YesN/AraC family two-component response regulator